VSELNFGLPKFLTLAHHDNFFTLFRASADPRLEEAIRTKVAKRST
jgi:hypothetical protein